MFASIFASDFKAQAAKYGKQARQALLDCAQSWSPRVEDSAPGAVLIDIDGLERLFGSAGEIAAAIQSQAGELGFRVNVAVAQNPYAAFHAAKGFSGITILEPGSEAERLENLPVRLLDPSEEIAGILQRWGIHTFGAFAALPIHDVTARLGKAGTLLHRQASGRAERPLLPCCEPLRFIEAMDLEYEIVLLEPLSFILSRLLEQACSRLKFRALATYEIRLSLNAFEHILRLPIPTQDSRLLLKLLMLDLEARPPGAPTRNVRIEAIHAKPRIVQHGLFIPLTPEPEKLELTLARIAGIVGAENVGSAELRDTHRPGIFQMKKFAPPSVDWRIPAPLRETARTVDGFRTFRPALEATVDMREGKPRWIAFSGGHGPILFAAGPWRTSGDWWRNDGWDRDEWDVLMGQTGHTTLYRIYQTRQQRDNNRWFVEGVYD